MTIVWGSPAAKAQQLLDARIESLPPCKCGAAPKLTVVAEHDGVPLWIVECSRMGCQKRDSSTAIYDVQNYAIVAWQQAHYQASDLERPAFWPDAGT